MSVAVAAVADLGQPEDAGLTDSGIQNRLVFFKCSWMVVQLFSLEILLHGGGNTASSCFFFVFGGFFPPNDLLVSPHSPSVCSPWAPLTRLRKAAAPGVSFQAVKIGNWGPQILLGVFAEKEKSSIKTKQNT